MTRKYIQSGYGVTLIDLLKTTKNNSSHNKTKIKNKNFMYYLPCFGIMSTKIYEHPPSLDEKALEL